MNLNEIGAALRSARKAMNRSQADLAASLGMSRATVSAIENGTVSEIGVRKLMALASALGLDLSIGPRRPRPTLQELRADSRAGKLGT
jgi:transcriptional regulator with XRE-family HTH domain